MEHAGQSPSEGDHGVHHLADKLTVNREMREVCTDEWCMATEHVIDDLSNWMFSISEPTGASDEDTGKLKALKRRLRDLYAKYKNTASR
jgi:hypothetical protein